MKKLWGWLRTLNAGEWIAIVVLFGGSAFVLWLVAANTWSAVVGSLQPEIVKFKGTEYDLIAQRSMSAAAWWMVVITGASTTVGSLGLYLVYRTLKEAKRSADAAEHSVQTARDIGHAQVRAYLSSAILTARFDIEPGFIMLDVEVRNSGQSPALFVNAWIRIQARYDWRDQTAEEIGFHLPAPDIFAGNVQKVPTRIPEGIPQISRLRVDRRLLSIEIETHWRDVFGQPYSVRQRFHGWVGNSEREVSLEPAGL